MAKTVFPELRNCRRCGKIYTFTGLPICKECHDKEEEEYEILRVYLREHPLAALSEASRDTGVPSEIIADFLRRGLLEGITRNEDVPRCAICKRPVISGGLCHECLGKMQYVDPKASGKAEDPRQRMYSGDMINKLRP